VRPLIVRLDLVNVAPRIPMHSDEPCGERPGQGPRARRARRIVSV